MLVPMRLALAAALVFLHAVPAWSYIDRSYTLGQIIAECDHIAVMKVHAVSKERGAIIYKKVADLKGKKVAYVPGGVSQLYWAIAARDAKLKPGDVEEVQLAADAVALAGFVGEPFDLDGRPLLGRALVELLARED